ncbi:MAG: hypothetical protein GF416_01835 [Candidatus Altiarchaeales archaeon]|nr:hypothetical protein [Candidatus Altiarchaeales archaeon]MBD3415857.1 hypothetical protein [Candidatus Altiarchaeales archaeon]
MSTTNRRKDGLAGSMPAPPGASQACDDMLLGAAGERQPSFRREEVRDRLSKGDWFGAGQYIYSFHEGAREEGVRGQQVFDGVFMFAISTGCPDSPEKTADRSAVLGFLDERGRPEGAAPPEGGNWQQSKSPLVHLYLALENRMDVLEANKQRIRESYGMG